MTAVDCFLEWCGVAFIVQIFSLGLCAVGYLCIRRAHRVSSKRDAARRFAEWTQRQKSA